MAVIPTWVYRLVEARLHHMGDTDEDAYIKACIRAMDVHGPGFDVSGGHGSLRHDKLERDAIAMIEAGEQLTSAVKWREAIRRAEDLLDEDCRVVMRLLYLEHKKQDEAAEILHYERQTIRRRRDMIVTHVALCAAEMGLIRMGGVAADADE